MKKSVSVAMVMADGSKSSFVAPFSDIIQRFIGIKIGDIKDLGISHCQFTTEDVNFILPLIPPTLQSLRISDCGMKIPHIKVLLKKLATVSLISLDLSYNPIGDESIWILLELLGKKESLLDINLSGCNLTGNGLFPLLNGLGRRQLNSLDLSENKFGYVGATYIQNYLKTKPKINYIICVSCDLSPADIDAVIEGVTDTNTIYIDLRNNEKILEKKLPPNVFANMYHMK